MSISFKRNGKWVELETFSNNDVIGYLGSKLNINNPNLIIAARPKFCNGIMAKYDDAYFVIYANKTYIELSFQQIYAEKMSEVIETITKWDKFSKTEKTFYVEIDENTYRTIIFENGYATCGDYRRRFGDDKIKITSF